MQTKEVEKLITNQYTHTHTHTIEWQDLCVGLNNIRAVRAVKAGGHNVR